MLEKHRCVFICLAMLFQWGNIQASYVPHHVELQNTTKNYAKSITSNGMIAGQLHVVDPITQEEQIVDYFWDLNQPEPVVITTDAHEGHFPVINNKGQVAGIIKRKSTSWWQGDEWWQRDTREIYRYDPHAGLTILSKPLGASFGEVVVLSITDDKEVTICDDQDPGKAEAFSVITNNDFLMRVSAPTFLGKIWTVNRTGHMLTCAPSFFDETHSFSFWHIWYPLFGYFPSIKGSIGIDLNEENQAIAKNQEGTEGYFLKDSNTCIELGSFIPSALNNHGEIVGKKEDSFFLRNTDGSMINLSSVINEKLEEITGISDQGHILGITNVNGQKKVIFLEHIRSGTSFQ